MCTSLTLNTLGVCCVSINFSKYNPDLFFYVAWGPMCIFFGYCGHSSNFAFWALPFLFPTNDIFILCVIWWGPVSISFLPANSIYKPSLCSDRVGGLYFTLFTNTNLPCGGVGAYVYNQVNNTWKCALGNKNVWFRY